MDCGERGIRTPGTFDSTSDFESGALNQLCHLSFTRRSAAARRARCEGGFVTLVQIFTASRSILTTNASSKTPSQTPFLNIIQIQKPYLDPEKNNTKPILQEVYPLLWAPSLFGVE